MAAQSGWTALVLPWMFVMSPDLILEGSPIDAAITFATWVCDVWLATVRLVGCFLQPLRWRTLVNFSVARIPLPIPAEAFHGADTLEFTGIAFAAVPVGGESWSRRQQRAAALSPG